MLLASARIYVSWLVALASGGMASFLHLVLLLVVIMFILAAFRGRSAA